MSHHSINKGLPSRTHDDPEEWWRRRLGRLVVADDEAVVRALFARRAKSPASGTAHWWRAWTVDRNWRRSRGPQVVVKAAGRRKSASGTWTCLRYVARLRSSDAQPVTVYDEFGLPVQAAAALAEWDLMSDRENLSRQARELPDGGAGLPAAQRLYYVQSHHLVISAGADAWSGVPEAERKDRLVRAIQGAVDALFAANGFRVLWAVHDDTPRPHAHLVVRAQSRFGPRLRLDRHGDVFDEMRQTAAEYLGLAGIEVQAVRREDCGELRQDIMAGRTFARWPRHPGNGDLAGRAPVWFAHFGEAVVRRMNGVGLGEENRPAPLVIPPDCRRAVDAFAVLFHDPAHALAAWRHLARGEGGKPAKALALWYLRKRPEIFGEVRPHARPCRDQAAQEADSLPPAFRAILLQRRHHVIDRLAGAGSHCPPENNKCSCSNLIMVTCLFLKRSR